MTFGSTFGRTFSPTFQPRSQAAAVASSWWLAGGIAAASCVAAYQPKGAADLAASYVNLANPGTYNASVPATYNAPTFDTSYGWQFAGGASKQLLSANFSVDASSQAYSALCAFSDGGTGSAYEASLFGTSKFTYIPNYKNAGIFAQNNNSAYKWGTYYTSGVMGISGINFYVDGSVVKSVASGSSSGENVFYIGNSVLSSRRIVFGKIKALCFYNAELDSTTMGLLTTAMAAL